LNTSAFYLKNINKLFKLSHDYDLFLNYGSRNNKPKIVINNTKRNTTESLLNELGIENITSIENNVAVYSDFSIDTELVYEKNNVVNDIKNDGVEIIEKNENNDNNKSDDNDSLTDSDDSNSEVNYSSDDEDAENNLSIENDTTNQNETDDEDKKELEESIGEEDEEDEENEEDEEGEEIEEEEEKQTHAYIHNFPVQMICLEKCDGTLDSLFTKGKIQEKEGASAMFQIVMILIIYQKVFHFTHNDLHTNNIMYINTKKEFLYYQFENIVYKVPTYGRIYKIIDFGRGIYKFNGHLFCSDSFGIGGDAYSQYNIEPFFNENKPRLEPNYSFDLCRMGCSIYDFIIDDEENIENMDDFQKTIYRWCLDDNGKNVLYKKNGEERYPNFKLYKMISRTVHNHTPQSQLKYSFFNQFVLKDAKKINKNEIMNIDNLPCYV
jgi:hypothetical protein